MISKIDETWSYSVIECPEFKYEECFFDNRQLSEILSKFYEFQTTDPCNYFFCKLFCGIALFISKVNIFSIKMYFQILIFTIYSKSHYFFRKNIFDAHLFKYTCMTSDSFSIHSFKLMVNVKCKKNKFEITKYFSKK